MKQQQESTQTRIDTNNRVEEFLDEDSENGDGSAESEVTEHNAPPTDKKSRASRQSSITRIRAVLKSTQPMLQHRISEEARDGLPGGRGELKVPNFKERTIEEEAEYYAYKGPNGEFGVTTEMVFACLVKAGTFIKYKGMKNLSSAKESMVPSFLTLETEDEFLPFKEQGPNTWVVDRRAATNPSTGGKMLATRPKFPKWEIEVVATIDHSGGVTLEMVRKLFEQAGRTGLGAHRLKGSFGRFRVANWEIISQE